VVFTMTEIVPLLKFRPKLNGMPCKHQLHCATCPIINFFFLNNEIKFLGWLHLASLGVAWPSPRRF
jgi:hypothetical protein